MPKNCQEDIPKIEAVQFYGKKAFLENNLGIEEDPKIVEIVNCQDQNSYINQDSFEFKLESQKTIKNDQFNETDSQSLIFSTEDSLVEPNTVSEVGITEPEIKDKIELDTDDKALSSNGDDLLEETSGKILKVSNTCTDGNEEKEKHFLSLGLLTREAALAAEEENNKLRELRNQCEKTEKRLKSSEYTGTLKTVIKLTKTNLDNRNIRMPLKMTFQKGKSKLTGDEDVLKKKQLYSIFTDLTVSIICFKFKQRSRELKNYKINVYNFL